MQSILPNLNVSRETIDRLVCYENLVRKWNPRINLVAKSTLDDFRNRHIQDSAQLFPHIPVSAKNLTDIGSGGGLPGIVMAILASELTPELQCTLIESDSRKSVFLRTVIRELDLNSFVVDQRIEDVQPKEADIVTARALAPLPTLLKYVHMHLKTDGTAVLPKGRAYQDEVRLASEHWSFDIGYEESFGDGKILVITNLRPKDA